MDRQECIQLAVPRHISEAARIASEKPEWTEADLQAIDAYYEAYAEAAKKV